MIRAYRDVAMGDDPVGGADFAVFMIAGGRVVNLSAFWLAAGDVARLCYARAIA